MTADEFAHGLCARLLKDKLFLPDSIPHREILETARDYWSEARAAIVAELEQAAKVDPKVPQRPALLPGRPHEG